MTPGPEEAPGYSALGLLVKPLVFSRPWGLGDAVSTESSGHMKEMLHHTILGPRSKCVKVVHNSDHLTNPYGDPKECQTPKHCRAVPKWLNSKDV
jgi:hypothetical protein